MKIIKACKKIIMDFLSLAGAAGARSATLSFSLSLSVITRFFYLNAFLQQASLFWLCKQNYTWLIVEAGVKLLPLLHQELLHVPKRTKLQKKVDLVPEKCQNAMQARKRLKNRIKNDTVDCTVYSVQGTGNQQLCTGLCCRNGLARCRTYFFG